jgi:hypothetical protein
MRAWIVAIAVSAITLVPTGQAGANHAFVRLICFGDPPVSAIATIEIDGEPVQLHCNEGQRVTEVAVAPHNPSWALHLEMTTPLGTRTILRQGTEWPLTLSTELDNRECQLDLHGAH